MFVGFLRRAELSNMKFMRMASSNLHIVTKHSTHDFILIQCTYILIKIMFLQRSQDEISRPFSQLQLILTFLIMASDGQQMCSTKIIINLRHFLYKFNLDVWPLISWLKKRTKKQTNLVSWIQYNILEWIPCYLNILFKFKQILLNNFIKKVYLFKFLLYLFNFWMYIGKFIQKFNFKVHVFIQVFLTVKNWY